jgi:peroxiredoxin/mono/diheme cytochrome c family protein
MSRPLFAVLALAAVAADPLPSADTIGTKAPAPTLTALDGTAAKFDALRGKAATVVVFVSFDCPVSKSYTTELADLAKAHADTGVAVVLVAPTDEPRDDVAKAAAAAKAAGPVFLDPKKELAAGLKATVTPEAFVLDADGVVRYRGRVDDAFRERLKRNPVVTSHDLKDAVAAVLAGKPVTTPVTKAVGCEIDFAARPAPKAGAVTFYKDVAPILNSHCVVCHRAGEVGPFPLTSFAHARRWAADVKEYTGNRQMPPWMPAAGLPIRGERKLSAKEIATLAAWADADAPEGDPKDAPKAPDFGTDGWRHGKPDLVITPGDDFRLGGAGDDLFRVFVVPTRLAENRWVVGYDVKPGNPRVVHHTLHYFDTTGQARKLEDAQREKDKGKLLMDGGPGYNASMGVGFIPSAGKKDAPTFGWVGGWAPGQAPEFVPAGAGWLLPKGADFLIQTHYHRNGQATVDRTQIGLYFAKGPVEQPWQTVVINGMKPAEKIPAGTANHVARGAVYLHTDAVLHNVLPHMHLLGKTVKVTMTPPGGKPVILIDIPAWDYRWQETYWFKEPITAKVGTKIEIEAVFDNSAGNPNNPTKPPRDVSVGEQTTDEMLFGFLGATSTTVPWRQVHTSAFPPPGVVAFDPPAKGQLTPELERRLGDWDTKVVTKPRGGAETTVTGAESVTRAFGGSYLMARRLGEGEERDFFELATFDPAAGKYRMWTYTSQGSVLEWDGAWDAKAEAFTWTSPFGSGVKGTVRWTFGAKDEIGQEFVMKLGFITAYSEAGTYTRRKK